MREILPPREEQQKAEETNVLRKLVCG